MKAERSLPVLMCLFSCGGRVASVPSLPEPVPSSSAPAPPTAPSASIEPREAAPSDSSMGVRPPMSDAPTPKIEPGMASIPAPSSKVEFPPHAGFEAAIKSVPQGAPRVTMSEEMLRAPLLELKRYERCKIPRGTKVHLRVAVYDGAAAGIDVTTKPKSARIDQCVDDVVRTMGWEKVASLNTITVNF